MNHQRRRRPRYPYPSVVCDAGGSHACGVYNEPEGVIGTHRASSNGVGPITSTVSINALIGLGRLRLQGAQYQERREKVVKGFHTVGYRGATFMLDRPLISLISPEKGLVTGNTSRFLLFLEGVMGSRSGLFDGIGCILPHPNSGCHSVP